MVVRYFAFGLPILFCCSCVHPSYKFEVNSDGEPILDRSLYTFNKPLNENDFKTIDTAAYYIETFAGLDSNEDQRANPRIYKFHKDGYFKKTSYMYFNRFDKVRGKNSVYYGGRYYTDKNVIFMESFFVIGPTSKRFSKVISKGVIENDTIIIDFFGTTHKYVGKTYSEIFSK